MQDQVRTVAAHHSDKRSRRAPTGIWWRWCESGEPTTQWFYTTNYKQLDLAMRTINGRGFSTLQIEIY